MPTQEAEAKVLTTQDVDSLCMEVASNVTEVVADEKYGGTLYKDNATGSVSSLACDQQSEAIRCVASRKLLQRQARIQAELMEMSLENATVVGVRQYHSGAWGFDIRLRASLRSLPVQVQQFRQGSPVVIEGTITEVQLFEPDLQSDSAEYTCSLKLSEAQMQSDGFK